jgi:hypothetical protein
MKYRVENGRTYHAFKDGSYMLPNDTAENERLDLAHHICVLTLGDKLCLSPVPEGKQIRVLDCGTGTGIWAMDFADEHQNAQVIGVDLSPIQPTYVPPNVTFYIDDLEADWTYTAPFDLVYIRMLAGSIKDWPRLYRQSFDNLAPGGYIEVFELNPPLKSDDDTFPETSALYKWTNLWVEGAAKAGIKLVKMDEHRQLLAEAGFVNLTEKKFKWPMNTWPKDPRYKELGAWVCEATTTGLHAMTMALFTRALGWSPEEVEIFLVEVRKEVANRKTHVYWPLSALYAQRPE